MTVHSTEELFGRGLEAVARGLQRYAAGAVFCTAEQKNS